MNIAFQCVRDTVHTVDLFDAGGAVEGHRRGPRVPIWVQSQADQR